MRTIKFRGRLKSNGNWEHGDLLHDNVDGCYVYPVEAENLYKGNEVIPKTVGQFTGLYDKDGEEIYEGDILQFGNSPSGVCEVKWNESIAAFCIRFHFENEIGSRPLCECLVEKKNISIIGNIHDNPELMKADEKSKD